MSIQYRHFFITDLYGLTTGDYMKKIVYQRTIVGKPYSGVLSKIWFMMVHPHRYKRYIRKKETEQIIILYSNVYYRHFVDFISDDIF
jgi:hypothetical protein